MTSSPVASCRPPTDDLKCSTWLPGHFRVHRDIVSLVAQLFDLAGADCALRNRQRCRRAAVAARAGASGQAGAVCEDPLAVRGDPLQCIGKRTFVPSTSTSCLSGIAAAYLVITMRGSDTRPVPWLLTVDGVMALFLWHLQRLDRAQLFDDAEPTFSATLCRCWKRWVRRCPVAFC